MKLCPFCKNKLADDAVWCPHCTQHFGGKNAPFPVDEYTRPRVIGRAKFNRDVGWTSLAWLIPIALIFYFAYVILAPKPPCQSPITYKIGTLDPRFGVTQSEFQADISQASDIWGNASGRQLFKYDPNGDVTISLVYDTRQQTTQAEGAIKTSIDQTGQMASSVKDQFQSLQASYASAQQDYTSQAAQFNQQQASYNKDVNYWNSRGGAPAAEYATLNNEKQALISRQGSLDAERQQVNQLADQINALIDKYNLLVNHMNSDVNTVNNDGLTGTTFEEGVYISDPTGRSINIYQFDDQASFIRVLAHEMGHALSLAHDSGTDSIMNPINQSQSLTLSPQDMQELKAECDIK